MSSTPSLQRAVAAACFAVLSSCHGTGAAPTPQRPTFSSDTSTTAEGTFELELGVAVDPADLFAVPATLKYGIGAGTEVFLGLPAYVHVEGQDTSQDIEGTGDLLVGTRQRFVEFSDGSSAALTLATKLPTADRSEGLSSGEIDFAGALGWSKSHDSGLSTTAYYQLDALGRPSVGGVDLSHNVALAIGVPISAQFGAFAELVRSFTEDDTDPTFGIAGLTFGSGASTVFDVAVQAGFDSDAPDVQLFLGVTTNLGGFAEDSPR